MGERGEVGWDQQSSLPSVLWREDTGIATNPVVFEDLVFGISANGTVRANNAQTGTNLWREPTGTSYPYPRAIAVFNSTLFVGDRTGRILALTPSTGEKRWERTLSGPVFGFSLYKDSVIVASSDGLRSIAIENGLVNWMTQLDTYSRSGAPKQGAVPVTHENIVFVRLEKGIAAVSAEDGTMLWNNDVSQSREGTIRMGGGLAVADGKVFAVSDSLTAYDIRDGRIQWSVESDGGGSSFRGNGMVSPVTNGKLVFSGTRTVLAIDVSDGSIVWKGGGIPYLGGDSLRYDNRTEMLYLSAMEYQKRTLIALNPDVGTESWREQIGTAGQASRYTYEHTISRATISDVGVHIACIGELVTLRTEEHRVKSDDSDDGQEQTSNNNDSQPEQSPDSVSEESDDLDIETDSDTYRGVLSNDPDRDIGTGLGDMYILTVLSTVLSLLVIVGQIVRRGSE
jgi:outer membrane protein assembly factor BamB